MVDKARKLPKAFYVYDGAAGFNPAATASLLIERIFILAQKKC
jgi:hypothetical protein